MSHVDVFRVKNVNCHLLSTETLIMIVSAMYNVWLGQYLSTGICTLVKQECLARRDADSYFNETVLFIMRNQKRHQAAFLIPKRYGEQPSSFLYGIPQRNDLPSR